MITSLLALALYGCATQDSGKEQDSGTSDSADTATTDSEDTSTTDTEDSGTTIPCTTTVLSTVPEDTADGVYYRDPLEVTFSDDGASAVFFLTAADSTTITPDVTWGEGNLKATLTAALAPSMAYTLTTTICDADYDATFTTSDLGTPLSIPVEDLVGRVYMFRIADAELTEPAVLEAFDDSYLTSPLLFEVTEATATSISLLGALGVSDEDTVYQWPGEPTWDFLGNDFTDQPTFQAESDLIMVTYSGVDIPIEQFTLQGTFAADGLSIEEGRVTGFVDTRDWGPLMGLPDEPDAVCDFAADFGVYCELCSDGEELCLYIVGEDIVAEYQEGMDLEAVVPE